MHRPSKLDIRFAVLLQIFVQSPLTAGRHQATPFRRLGTVSGSANKFVAVRSVLSHRHGTLGGALGDLSRSVGGWRQMLPQRRRVAD